MSAYIPLISSAADIDGQYRYSLTRRWVNKGLPCLFIMLNPSTADATRNDPTIRRCIGFAKQWGHSALTVGNIFAVRATDPAVMKAHSEPVGYRNDDTLVELAGKCSRIVCAWGNHGTYRGRGDEVKRMLWSLGHRMFTFRITKEGQPMHPLYQPFGAELKEMLP